MSNELVRTPAKARVFIASSRARRRAMARRFHLLFLLSVARLHWRMQFANPSKRQR
jgi:hypothetical protein